jgi:6-phosphogluconolactonase
MPLAVLDSPGAVAAAAAERVAACARDAVAARGAFHVALSGGRTTEPLHRLLAADPWRARVPWAETQVWFADERAVPPDDPASNLRMARETLLDPVGLGAERIHALDGARDDLEAAARDYAASLPSALDLIVLGVGEDGHVASLFPGSPLLAEAARRAAAVTDSPKPPARRVTLTPASLAAARRVLVLATGPAKRDAVAAALAPAGDVRATPARLVRGREWLVDRAAAAAIPR